MPSPKSTNVKKLTQLSMFLTIALIIFVLEAQIPPLAPIPGIKLGLANIITLVTMLLYSKKDALLVLILRIALSSIFVGSVSIFIYSLAGGLVSFLFMALLSLKLKKDKLWVISTFGAIGHNIGQITMAILVTGTWGIIFYFPILFISAIVTGIFTGVTAQLLLDRLNIFNKIKNDSQ